MRNNNRKLLYIFFIAVCLRLVLYFFVEATTPQSKIQIDTKDYLETGMTLVSKGAFATQDKEGRLQFHVYRTPGYPLFLGVFHGLFKLSLPKVILVQFLLTLLAAFFVYQSAFKIDERLGLLSAFIILFDPPILFFSLTLLTESLFLFLICLFLFFTLKFLKTKRIIWLILSALSLVMVTYVRPVSYYLAIPVSVFIFLVIYKAVGYKKALLNISIFLVTVYSCLGLWHYRNYQCCRQNTFSNIDHATIHDIHGLWGHYTKNYDSVVKQTTPVQYYFVLTVKCLGELMTNPGSFKDFTSSYWIKGFAKVFSYFFMAFWLSGFLIGLFTIKKDVNFFFLLLIIVYFTGVTIVAITMGVGSRFRIPMMPFIAIISSSGWVWLMNNKLKEFRNKK